MVFVAILVGTGVLMGFVALAVDGGSAVLQRRVMQNSADAAAIGAAQLLANNVAYQGRSSGAGGPHELYLIRNQDIISNVNKLLSDNRGGTFQVEAPIAYTTVISYGTYNPVSHIYNYTTAAISTIASTWVYPDSQVQPDYFAPANIDAVQVSAQVDNPTAFARVIGINTVHVGAIAAAALIGDANYVPQGSTWPMTANFRAPAPDQTFTYTAGICQPFLFYDTRSGNTGRFENLLSLAALEGASFSNHYGGVPTPAPQSQMITVPDERPDLTNQSGSPRNNPCNSNRPNRWYAAGSCSNNIRDNNICCRTPDEVSDRDVPNWIYYGFSGVISPTTRSWIDPPNNRQPTYYPPGDWIETYIDTNSISDPGYDNDVVASLRSYIQAHGTKDPLYSLYGLHVDRVMYMYDLGEVWRLAPPTSPNGVFQGAPVATNTPSGGTPTPTQTVAPTATPTPTPYFAWRPANPGEQPDRVHIVDMTQAAAKVYKFRFYGGMILDTANTFTTVSGLCDPTSIIYNGDEEEVYAVPVGEALNAPPTDANGQPIISAHGLYNYVGFTDPSP